MEVIEWNKKWSPPFPCCPISRQYLWKKTLIEKKIHFGRLDKIPVFHAVSPPLMFLLKSLHCSYENYNEFRNHERLFIIMVQQVLQRGKFMPAKFLSYFASFLD